MVIRSQDNVRLSGWTLLATIFSIVVFINLSDFWLHGLAHLTEVYLAIVVIIVAARHWHLSWGDMGLARSHIKSGLKWGLLSTLAIGLFLIIAYTVAPDFFADQRYQVDWVHTGLTIFVSIPIVTVIFEELIFRGVMLSALRKHFSLNWAVAISSISFGLWHTVTSLHIYSTSSELGKTTAALAMLNLVALSSQLVPPRWLELLFAIYV